MPVSRKRKKSRKTKVSHVRTATRTTRPRPSDQPAGRNAAAALDLLGQLVGNRDELRARRVAVAAPVAEEIVAELVELAPGRPDTDLEEEWCARLGARLREAEGAPVDDLLDPDVLADVAIQAAAEAVRVALDEPAAVPEGWRPAWRVLAALVHLVPRELDEAVAEAVGTLRGSPGGKALPRVAAGPTVTGPVCWVRDRYGSRFGVVAPFSAPDGPDRWYLWDVDACGYVAYTVHSAYYPTPERALAAWRDGVGQLAAGDVTPTPVDDPWLLAELLPVPVGIPIRDEERVAPPAECFRSRSLAEKVAKATRGNRRPLRPHDPKAVATAAAAEFASWLRARGAWPLDGPAPTGPADAGRDDGGTRDDGHAGSEAPDAEEIGLDELVEELAESWYIDGPLALYHTCSPHRVGVVVPHLRNFYLDDYAERLIALLPDWASWLAERNDTPPELAERCRPYALGQRHPAIGDDERSTDQARVLE